MSQTTAQLQAELEEIIAWFESDDVSIDNAAERYERGLLVAEELKKRLSETRNKITKLKKSFIEP